jgi:hypothetical protein
MDSDFSPLFIDNRKGAQIMNTLQLGEVPSAGCVSASLILAKAIRLAAN